MKNTNRPKKVGLVTKRYKLLANFIATNNPADVNDFLDLLKKDTE